MFVSLLTDDINHFFSYLNWPFVSLGELSTWIFSPFFFTELITFVVVRP